jgi:hypothetical protein
VHIPPVRHDYRPPCLKPLAFDFTETFLSHLLQLLYGYVVNSSQRDDASGMMHPIQKAGLNCLGACHVYHGDDESIERLMAVQSRAGWHLRLDIV